MSFIYAKKVDNSIVLLADTKITFDKSGTILLWSNKTKELVRQFGLIKNIVVNRDYCIAFAGNPVDANNLLRCSSASSMFQDVLNAAVDIHKKSLKTESGGTDFIICHANNHNQKIYQIKDNNCTEVDVSWIGSEIAFRYFQEVNLDNKSTAIDSNDPLGAEISFGHAANNPFDKECDRLFNVFYKTVFDCIDDTVGGFVVPVIYSNAINQFIYKGYSKSFQRIEIVNSISHLPMYQPASKGAYSVLFYTSHTIPGMYIPQDTLGVIYSKRRISNDDYSNNATSSLLLPTINKIPEIDYYIQVEQHGLRPPSFYSDPDNIDEIDKRIWFCRDNPAMALLYVDKIIEIICTQHRDEYRLEKYLAIKSIIEAALQNQ